MVLAMVFPVVMYGCESWTIKKAECRRIDAFELWCWRSHQVFSTLLPSCFFSAISSSLGLSQWDGKKHPHLFTCSPLPLGQGFPGGSAGKESACNVRELGLIPGLGRSPGEGNSYPIQYSGLENSMDCIVHGVAKSRTGLNDFHFHFHC